ncbi:MAG: RAD55 family ATPase [Halolamina sp.]
MERIPFGVARLDDTLGGGAPPGSVVLLAGESGAGAREFLYTAAATHALRAADPELFDLYYGDEPTESQFPPEVHYLSFTADRRYIEREMTYTMADDIVEAAVPEIDFRDFSPEYFQLSPIPREWYVGETSRITDLGADEGRKGLMEALGDYLNEHAAGNVVCIDSVTDLVGAAGEGNDWSDASMLLQGIEKAAHNWGGIVLLLVNTDSLTDQQLGQLTDAASGTFEFNWASGGSQRARTMVVKAFRGVLSRLKSENIDRFETEIHDGGFDISDVRKIR